MRKLFINQLNRVRRLRWLFLLYALLLVPIGAWAQDSYFAINTKTGSHWVTDETADDVLEDGSGKIKYDITNNILILDGIDLAFTSDYFTDAFIAMVDSDHPGITVHLVGSNTLTLGDKASVFNGTSITFTAEDVNASLTIKTESVWAGALFLDSQSSDPINATYNNHLFLDYDAANKPNEYTIQTLSFPLINSYDDGNNIVFGFGYQTGNNDEVIHYSIDYVDESLQDVTDAEFDVSGDNLPLSGPCTMTYYTTAGGGQSETITAKLFGLATNSVTTTLGTPVAPPTIIPAFDHSEDVIITETQAPATGVTPVYDGTTGLISTSAVGETTCSVKVDYYEASSYDYLVLNGMDDNQKYIFGTFTLTVNEVVNYNLQIGDTQVTSANANDIFGNATPGEVNGEGSASFAITTDPTTDEEVYTLTLENATINDYQEWSVFFDYPKLTVHLIGENHIVNGFHYYGQTPETGTVEFTSDGGEENCLIFDSAESVDDLSKPDYYVGFSQCTYNDISDETGWTFGTDNTGHVKLYKQVPLPDVPFFYTNIEESAVTMGFEYAEGEVHYTIDYVSEDLQDVEETTWTYEDGDITIDGPCTVTAFVVNGGLSSATVKGKYFEANPNPFRLVYNAAPVDLVLSPAIDEDDGISIIGIEANVSYNTQTGQISSSTMGRFSGPVAMSETEGKTTILNNYFYMNFEVVPPAPAVSLEAGSYLATHDPITLTGTGEANTRIMYAWDDEDAQEYTEAILFHAGTLVAWEEYIGGDMPLSGDTTTVVYTLATDLGITYASGQTWATYYATENLTVPEGLTAYVVSSVNAANGTVTTEAFDYIPENQAVLLKHSEGAPLSGFVAAPYTGPETTVSNLLSGSAEAVSISSFTSGTVYVLHNDDFTRATSGTIPARRGYLLLDAAPVGSRLAIITHDVTTGLGTDVMADTDPTVYYNLNGQRIAKPRHGMYIVNGRKIIR